MIIHRRVREVIDDILNRVKKGRWVKKSPARMKRLNNCSQGIRRFWRDEYREGRKILSGFTGQWMAERRKSLPRAVINPQDFEYPARPKHNAKGERIGKFCAEDHERFLVWLENIKKEPRKLP